MELLINCQLVYGQQVTVRIINQAHFILHNTK